MTIYHAGHSICEEQCDIVGKDIDLIVLSSALRALPRLREIAVHFQVTLDEHDWPESYSDSHALCVCNDFEVV